MSIAGWRREAWARPRQTGSCLALPSGAPSTMTRSSTSLKTTTGESCTRTALTTRTQRTHKEEHTQNACRPHPPTSAHPPTHTHPHTHVVSAAPGSLLSPRAPIPHRTSPGIAPIGVFPGSRPRRAASQVVWGRQLAAVRVLVSIHPLFLSSHLPLSTG